MAQFMGAGETHWQLFQILIDVYKLLAQAFAVISLNVPQRVIKQNDISQSRQLKRISRAISFTEFGNKIPNTHVILLLCDISSEYTFALPVAC